MLKGKNSALLLSAYLPGVGVGGGLEKLEDINKWGVGISGGVEKML